MDTPKLDLSGVTGFDWDAGNRQKNWTKHRVGYQECEEVFFNKPFFVYADSEHSQKERRYYALGTTELGRRLFLSFTVRVDRVRVICGRDQSRKERRWYETQIK